MDRDYLEKHLSAYLDGELSDSEARQFETELEKYPDLKVRFEEYRAVDRKMRESDAEMPAEGYFENLAMRIEARIEQTSPAPQRSFIERLLHPSTRVLAWAGSMAAVLLIAVVGYETYKPAVQEYSRPVPRMRAEPHVTTPGTPEGTTGSQERPVEIKSQRAASPQAQRSAEAASGSVKPKPEARETSAEMNLMDQAENAVQATKGGAKDEYEKAASALSAPEEGTTQTAVQPTNVPESEKASKIKAEVAPVTAKPALQLDEVLQVSPDSVALQAFGPRKGGMVVSESQTVASETPAFDAQLTGGPVRSEAEFDSLINDYTLRSTAQGDSLATATAYQRAVQYKTPDYIDVARRMLEKQLEKAEGDKLRDHYTKLLESLSDL